MITEKTIASVFSEFWTEALPLLTPSFVRIFNEAYCEHLAELPSSKFVNIEISNKVEKHDLVAEFAFCAAETIHNSAITMAEFADDKKALDDTYKRAVRFLKRYQSNDYEIALNTYEISESLKIAEQYERFFKHLKLTNNQIIFRPQLKGSGFLGSCTADLSVDDTLYEIKTVTRNISGKDVRQILIYLLLQSSSDDKVWTHAGFFNPRKAEHYRFSVDHLIYKTSGGRSKSEVFEMLTNFLGERGVEIDTIF